MDKKEKSEEHTGRVGPPYVRREGKRNTKHQGHLNRVMVGMIKKKERIQFMKATINDWFNHIGSASMNPMSNRGIQ